MAQGTAASGTELIRVDYEDVARATSDRGEVVLRRRGVVLELRVNGVFVMDTAETGSEIELARAALAAVDEPTSVLVGGLGLGFTAHEVLADTRVERVLVVELEESLIGWMRDGTIPHGPEYLADERLQLTEGDVRHALAEASDDSFDLVLLDVDNGPGYLVHEANSAVYERPFLAECARAMTARGALVIWSASESPELEQAMADVFGSCEVRAHQVRLQERDERYWLLLSRMSE